MLYREKKHTKVSAERAEKTENVRKGGRRHQSSCVYIWVCVKECACMQGKNEGEERGTGRERKVGGNRSIHGEGKRGGDIFFLLTSFLFLLFFPKRSLYCLHVHKHLVSRSLFCLSMTVLPLSYSPLLKPAVPLSPCTWTQGVLFFLGVLPLRWPPSTQERDTACRRERERESRTEGQKGAEREMQMGEGKGL